MAIIVSSDLNASVANIELTVDDFGRVKAIFMRTVGLKEMDLCAAAPC